MKTTRPDYDYTPLPASRVFKNFMRYKLMPFGNIDQGPGIVWLLAIWFRHRLGLQIGTLKIKHKKQFDRLLFIRHKLLSIFR